MSVNLIELVKGQLGDSVLDQMGGMLGESSENMKAAVDAGVPTILGSIVDKVSGDSSAAGMLSSALDGIDGSIADDFTSHLHADNQEALQESGNKLTSSLFGDSAGGVADMIGQVSGISSKSSSSLIGMIMPLVLGFLGKQRSNDGLDQQGMIDLLKGQTANISDAMPSGMSNLLGKSGMLSGLTGMLSGTAAAASDAVGDAASGVADLAGSAVDAAGDAAGAVADTAGNVAGAAKDAVGDAASGAADLAGSAVDAAGDAAGAVADTAGNVAGAAKDAVGDAASGAADLAGSAVDAAGDAAGAVADTAGNVAGAAKDAVGSAASGAADMAGNAADSVGDAAAAGGSMIKKILPIAAVVLVILFLLKQCL